MPCRSGRVVSRPRRALPILPTRAMPCRSTRRLCLRCVSVPARPIRSPPRLNLPFLPCLDHPCLASPRVAAPAMPLPTYPLPAERVPASRRLPCLAEPKHAMRVPTMPCLPCLPCPIQPVPHLDTPARSCLSVFFLAIAQLAFPAEPRRASTRQTQSRQCLPCHDSPDHSLLAMPRPACQTIPLLSMPHLNAPAMPRLATPRPTAPYRCQRCQTMPAKPRLYAYLRTNPQPAYPAVRCRAKFP